MTFKIFLIKIKHKLYFKCRKIIEQFQLFYLLYFLGLSNILFAVLINEINFQTIVQFDSYF